VVFRAAEYGGEFEQLVETVELEVFCRSCRVPGVGTLGRWRPPVTNRLLAYLGLRSFERGGANRLHTIVGMMIVATVFLLWAVFFR